MSHELLVLNYEVNNDRFHFRRYPVLLQGETSVGKTSLINWLAQASGNVCLRINNHDHTDLQEYVGCYAADNTGKLVFQEGSSFADNFLRLLPHSWRRSC